MAETIAKVSMTPTHPGEFIREEVIEPLDLSVTKAAEILRVRRATLSDFLNEKASLSPEMALRLEKAFGVSMDTMLNMQAWHDTHTMRGRAPEIEVDRYEPV
jgi:addiction module HigA family antidote